MNTGLFLGTGLSNGKFTPVVGHSSPHRGATLKINPKTKTFEVFAVGLRHANGITAAPNGDIFVTDNQGDWLPGNKLIHVQQGQFYGHQPNGTDHPFRKRPVTGPLVWVEQNTMGRSPGEPCFLDRGIGPSRLYQGQILFGDVVIGGVKRAFMERVKGVSQGCLFDFTQGLSGGVNRMKQGPDGELYLGIVGAGTFKGWYQEGKANVGIDKLIFNGQVTFECLSAEARADGFVLTFTKPVNANTAGSGYNISSYRNNPSGLYGAGSQQNKSGNAITNVSISADRRKVFLKINGMSGDGRVYVIKMPGSMRSENNDQLWTTIGWYTMNVVSDVPLGSNPPPPPPANKAPTVAITAPANGASLTAPATIAIAATAADSDGTVAKVEFFNGAAKLGEDAMAPYAFTIGNAAAGTYALTAKATDNDGATTMSAAVTVTVKPKEPTTGAVTGFQLVDAAADKVIGPLVEGAVINLAATPSRSLTIVVTASATGVASLRFAYDGNAAVHLELSVPYALAGDQANGADFFPAAITVGAHVLTATPFASADGTGTPGAAKTIRFTVIDQAQPPAGALPAPWATADIGAVASAGRANLANGNFTIAGSGNDIWNRSDEFRFAHQAVTGDFEIVARVASQTDTHPWAKAGLMMRESLAGNARHAFVLITPRNGVAFQRRTETSGVSAHTAGSRAKVPRFLRLVRTGDLVSGFESADGQAWLRIATVTIAMPDAIQVGLAVTSHRDGVLSTAMFDQVRITTAPVANQ